MYIYYLTHGFIASTRPFNLPTCAFSLPTRAFYVGTRAFSLLNRGFELLICEFEVITRGFELITRNSQLVFYFCTLKKKVSEELIPAVWHPKRWWDWCVSEDEKKEIDPMFIKEL